MPAKVQTPHLPHAEQPSPLLLAVDAGTTVIKAVAFSTDGHELASVALANSVQYGVGARAEQDMSRTWQLVAQALQELQQKLPRLARDAVALALTGQADGTWLVDAAHAPVGPAILWLDGRSAEVLATLQQYGGAQDAARKTRTRLNTSQQGVQLRWLQDHEPERLAQAAWALHCKDWLFLCCTGLARTDLSEGTFTFGNAHNLAYEPDVLRALGLEQQAHLLPEMVDSLRFHAPLNAQAALATGLPQGLPVVLAPLDVACATLGSGQLANGLAHGVSVIGSAGIHTRLYGALRDMPRTQPKGYLWPLASSGIYQAAMSQMAAALNIDWFAGLLAEAAALLGAPALPTAQLLQRMEAAAASAPPGAALYHPFIAEAGERSPLLAPLARAQFSGLTQSTSLAALCRAVYEGLAFSARDAYEAMGSIPAEVCLIGGAARSPLLRQVFANVLQRPIRLVQREEVGAAGAAMVAAVALGLYPDLHSVSARWVEYSPPDVRILPDADAPAYDKLFHAYRSGYLHSDTYWKALHQARSPTP